MIERFFSPVGKTFANGVMFVSTKAVHSPFYLKYKTCAVSVCYFSHAPMGMFFFYGTMNFFFISYPLGKDDV